MKFKIYLITMVLLSTLILAVPNLDNHQFYGAVSWDEDSPAIESVKLVVSDQEFISSVTDVTCDKICTGKYGYEGNILRVLGTAGATVQFYMGDSQVTTHPYESGGITKLDLSISTVELPKEDCDGDWQCTGWGSCIADIQTRSCSDANECDPNFLSTEQEQVCTGQTCSMEWLCTEWSSCLAGKKTRTCNRNDNCGIDVVSVTKPTESGSCTTVNSLVPPPGDIGSESGDIPDFISIEDEIIEEEETEEEIEVMSPTLIFGMILILLTIAAAVFYFMKKPTSPEGY